MVADKYFLGRQPILDRDQQLTGFELLFRSSDANYADIADYSMASANVILNSLTEFGIREILGKHKGFFNVDANILMSDLLELLPKEQVVIELLENINVTDTVIERCRDLKNKGFVLALDDNIFTSATIPLYETVDIVKIDILQVPATELPRMVKQLRNWPLALVAEKVETREHFSFCKDLGFELFQGYFFARPSVIHQKRLDIARIELINLVNEIMAEADITVLEACFKRNPNLSINLLRLVNSVAFGLREKIRSLRHALMVLGQRQLLRWVTLALFANDNSASLSTPLMELAAIRGRLMELLAQFNVKKTGCGDYPDRAFITGILSLADALFETSMESLVGHLNLSEEISAALISREGLLGRNLQMIEKLEQNEFNSVSQRLESFGLASEELLTAQITSISWTNGMMELK
jgi:c-di-GMP-related signal transduction protein